MSVKSDKWIMDMAQNYKMIEPFVVASNMRQRDLHIISYGVSSYGYDIRLAPEFRVFTNLHSGVIDPKDFDSRFLFDYKGDTCIIPPNSFALARSIEYFRIPRNVITICIGKSTYARVGLVANVTAFEPEWEGHVTIELSNTAPSPVMVYANEGIVQVIFFEADEECSVSYKDKHGKYMGQTGIQTAKA